MKITKLVLKGYKRLNFGQSELFELTPVRYCQLLVGSNGRGKSSIMGELNPLPSNKKDFHNGGYKEIWIEHNNREYVISQKFPSGECSFCEAGELINRNVGGTQQVQKVLCENVFGYTADIHRLITSQVRFTDMTPKERKDWFIRVSDIDYQYVLSIYQAVIQEQKELKSVINYVTKKIADDSSSVISEEEISDLKQRVKVLESEIECLLKSYNPALREVTLVQHIQSTHADHERLIKQYREYLRIDNKLKDIIYRLYRDVDMPNLQDVTDGWLDEIERKCNESLLDTVRKYERIHSEIKRRRLLDQDDLRIKELEQTIADRDYDLSGYEIDSPGICGDIESMLTHYHSGDESAYESLIRLLGDDILSFRRIQNIMSEFMVRYHDGIRDITLLSKPGLHLDFDGKILVFNGLVRLQNDLEGLVRESDGCMEHDGLLLHPLICQLNFKEPIPSEELLSRLKTLFNDNKTKVLIDIKAMNKEVILEDRMTCPKCGYSGSGLVKRTKTIMLKDKSDRHRTIYSSLKEAESLLDIYLNDIQSLMEIHQDYRRMIDHIRAIIPTSRGDHDLRVYDESTVLSELKLVKDELGIFDLVEHGHSSHGIKEHIRRLNEYIHIATLMQRRKKAKDELDLILKNQSRLNLNDCNLEKLEQELIIIAEEQTCYKEALSLIAQIRKGMKARDSFFSLIKDQYKGYTDGLRLIPVVIRNEDTEVTIRDKRIELGRLMELIKSQDSKRANVEQYRKDLESYQDRYCHTELLATVLSPTEGIIAHSLSSFIDDFISNMNILLSKIWSYPLSIIPCQDSKDELDFRFEVCVGDPDNVIPDISLSSSGMKEVINLAFKINAMLAMGLGDYPLFLDEFGSSFDEEHRANAVSVIKSIIEQREHTQLFIVSHYHESHGAIPDKDTIDLNRHGDFGHYVNLINH